MASFAVCVALRGFVSKDVAKHKYVHSYNTQAVLTSSVSHVSKNKILIAGQVPLCATLLPSAHVAEVTSVYL